MQVKSKYKWIFTFCEVMLRKLNYLFITSLLKIK